MKLFEVGNIGAGKLMVFFEDRILGKDFKGDVPIGLGLENHQYLDSVEDALQRIDSKAGALLTHISMMITAGTFVISRPGTSLFETVVIGIELSVYLLLALCCVRCLLYRDVISGGQRLNGDGPDRYRRILRENVVRSGTMLNFAVRQTFVVTFAFALSLILNLLV